MDAPYRLKSAPPVQATAEVCPNAEPSAPGQSVSAWVREKFDFTPSPRQAEVLDCDAKYLILCCNRQWGKTTTIAIKSLHRALHTPGDRKSTRLNSSH